MYISIGVSLSVYIYIYLYIYIVGTDLSINPHEIDIKSL